MIGPRLVSLHQQGNQQHQRRGDDQRERGQAPVAEALDQPIAGDLQRKGLSADNPWSRVKFRALETGLLPAACVDTGARDELGDG